MDRARRRFIQGLAPAAVAASLPGALRASALAEASREGQDPSSGGEALERSPGKGFAYDPAGAGVEGAAHPGPPGGRDPTGSRAGPHVCAGLRLSTADRRRLRRGLPAPATCTEESEAELGLPPMHVWRAWEDTAADTGFYLAALSWQYRCTGDPLALRRCRRTLRALKTIYDLGAQAVEPGFLCKPYGGKASNQTSPDQLQCVSSGLDAYRRIAGGL